MTSAGQWDVNGNHMRYFRAKVEKSEFHFISMLFYFFAVIAGDVTEGRASVGLYP